MNRMARLGREGWAVSVAMILVLNPWVGALSASSRASATLRGGGLPPSAGSPGAGTASSARLKEAVQHLPLYFVENRGQADPRVAYYVQGSRTSVYFTHAGITYALSGPAKSEAGAATAPPAEAGLQGPASARERWAVKLDFVGANPDAKPAGEDRTEAVVSYFKGYQADWKTDLPTYGRVAYANLWPGIDLVYTGVGGRLKYTFVVRPGADPKRIALAYRGATAVQVSPEGRLAVSTPVGLLEEDTPYVYQEAGEERVEVEAAYALEAEEAGGTRRFGFRVGPYDSSKPLFLDPLVLAYCGYIGGSVSDFGFGVAADSAGNAYVTGYTSSDEASFPVTVGPDLTLNGNSTTDAFVAKVNAAGTALVYCGYIGGRSGDSGWSVAVDSAGNAYVAGETQSTHTGGTPFPVTVGPDLTFNGGTDGWVAKVNAAGTALIYCGYIGGSGVDSARGIAVDSAGNAYVTGYTNSSEASFPVTVGAWDTTYGGGGFYDVFVAKVNAAGTALVYCGYIGGSADDYGRGVAVDSAGNAYVAGYTASTEATFPVTGGPDLTYNGGSDAFVAKVNAAGTALVYCGYIGGSGGDIGFGVAVDSAGNAYVTGYTASTEATFPVMVGPDLTFNGGFEDAFVAKVNASGALVYCGYIGGSGDDFGRGVAVDGAGNAYVTGDTSSTEATFPVTGGPDLTFNGGTSDAFVAKVNAAGTALLNCGYIGGSGNDVGQGVALDGSGGLYVTGYTTSTEATFPVTVGPDLTFNGATDAFVAKINVVTTAVELLSFEASPLDSAVELRWQTGSELKNLGFHLYRSSSAEGPYERITSTVIPGLGSSPEGASYSYVGGGLANGVTYFYELEDIETTGKTKLHGPVWAAPQASSPASGGAGGSSSGDVGSGSSGGLSTTKTGYGDPTSVSLRVLETDERHALLELRTGGFYAVRQADGSVRLEIPGMEEVLDPGLPGLPVRRAFVEAVVGRGVRLGAVVSHDVLSFPDLRPALSGSPEMVVGSDGVARARVKRAKLARPLEPGPFPVRAARLVGTAFQGEEKKALVELWPLRWDASANRLQLARRLLVRLEFAGKEEGESSRGGLSRGRRVPRPLGPSTEELLAQLVVRQRGLHAVSFEDLFGSRGRRLDVSELRLSRQGEPVGFHLEPDRSSFGSGSVLYFFSEGASLNPYGNEAVYELSLSRSGGLTMPLVSAFPSGSAASFAWGLKRWEENRSFQPGLLEAPDLWLWDILVAPVKKGYHFALDSLVPASEPSQLTVFLQGGSDQEGVADHHVRVSVNGTAVGEATWDGQTPQALPASIGPGILREGDNLLELESLGDAGASYSLVFLDRFELAYPRSLSAPGGLFEARFSRTGGAEVAGLGATSLLLDITSPTTLRWLFGASPTPNGIAFRAEDSRQYLALSAQNVLPAEVRLPLPSSLGNPRNRADYLLLAPQAFLAAAQPLLDLRAQQGLAVKAAALEEVYQDFGHGEAAPQAIRDFIAYAYHSWQSPSPRYVVLLGDATYDYKDFLHTGVMNRVPPLLVKTSFLWTASDTAYAAVNGEDLLPDLALGRLPAASVEEAQALVEKVIAFESSGLTLAQGPAVLVADNPDLAGDFETSALQAAPLLAPAHPVETIFLRELGSATRPTIAAAFDRGAALVSYLGHGGIAVWASENVFNNQDVKTLAPQPQQPLLLTMDCLNGYFHFPFLNSLAEELLKAPGKGSIASFSPTGLSLLQPADLFHKALLQEITSGRHERLGDAVLAAQVDFAQTGAFPELLSIYNLLGDPALRIR